MSERLFVDHLANEIRRVDGAHSLGAGALAEALLPFLTEHGGMRTWRPDPAPTSPYRAAKGEQP